MPPMRAVTHFKITGISNGTLYKNDGTTAITNGTFITFAEGSAGLKFTPTANFSGYVAASRCRHPRPVATPGWAEARQAPPSRYWRSTTHPLRQMTPTASMKNSTLVIAPSTSNLSHWWGFNDGASSQTTADAGTVPPAARWAAPPAGYDRPDLDDRLRRIGRLSFRRHG